MVGLLLTAGVTADIVVGGEYSIGRHLPADIGRGEMVGIFKVIYAFVVVVTAALGAVKFSVLCLYLRMTPDRRHRRVIGWVTGVVVLRYLVVQVVSVFVPFYFSFRDSSPCSSFFLPCLDFLKDGTS